MNYGKGGQDEAAVAVPDERDVFMLTFFDTIRLERMPGKPNQLGFYASKSLAEKYLKDRILVNEFNYASEWTGCGDKKPAEAEVFVACSIAEFSKFCEEFRAYSKGLEAYSRYKDALRGAQEAGDIFSGAYTVIPVPTLFRLANEETEPYKVRSLEIC